MLIFSTLNTTANAAADRATASTAASTNAVGIVTNTNAITTINKGVAMSMAMDGITQAFNSKGSIGFGVARFNGYEALAIGASYHDNENGLTYSIKGAQSGDGSSKANADSVGLGILAP